MLIKEALMDLPDGSSINVTRLCHIDRCHTHSYAAMWRIILETQHYIINTPVGVLDYTV